MAAAATATTTTITTCFYAVGTLVNVQARTGPGINKLGGVGKVTAAHVPNEKTNLPERYDIKYVLGGTEKAVVIDFIDPYQDDIGGRRRGGGGGESARKMGILKDRNGVLKSKHCSSSKVKVYNKKAMIAAKKMMMKQKEVEQKEQEDCCDEDSLIGMTIVVSVAAEDEVEEGKRKFMMEDDDDSCFLARDVSPYRQEVALFSENTGGKRVSLSVPDRTSSKVCLKGLFPEKKKKKKEEEKLLKENLKEKLEEKKKRRKREKKDSKFLATEKVKGKNSINEDVKDTSFRKDGGKKNNKFSGGKNIIKKKGKNQKDERMKIKEKEEMKCNVSEVGKNVINDNDASNEEVKGTMLTQMNGKECNDFAREKEIKVTEENDMEAEMPKEKQVVDEIREKVQDVSKEGFSSFSVVVFKAIREGCDMISFHELFQYVNKYGKQSYTEDDTRKYLITLDKKDLLMFCQSSDMIYTI